MSPTNKFSQASKHSNTIAVTYKLIQRSFFGLMSVLLVTTLSIAMVGQISVSAISNEISQDPVVLAQQYLDNSQNSVSFTKSKSLESVIQYLKSKNFEASNVVAYSAIEIDNQFLDIPFSLNLSQGISTNQKNFDDSKNNLLLTIKQSKTDKVTPETPTEIPLGDVTLNIKQAQTISDQKIDEAKKLQSKIKIDRVSFVSNNNSPEIKAFEKSNKKVDVKTNKSAINKTLKGDDSFNTKTISDNEIDAVAVKKPTEDERVKVLEDARSTKEGIIRKANEKALAPKIKIEKEQAFKIEKEQIKIKKSELSKKIKNGKQNEITLKEIDFIGDEAKEIGVDVIISKSEKEVPKIKIDTNKAKNYTEPKELSLIENLFSIGGLKASAFYPEQNYANIYHASPNEHFGVALAIQNGNTANGATIRNEYSYSTWTQKFYMYNDDTIRIAGKCLDMSYYGKIQRGENANNVKVHLWDCNGGNNQKWVYDSEGLLRMKYNKDYCLDTSWSGDYWKPNLCLEVFNPRSY